MTKLEKEDMKEIIKTLARIMKGAEIKYERIRKVYSGSPSRRETIDIKDLRYNTISRQNYIDGGITNTKDGKVFYVPGGHPLSSSTLLTSNDIQQTIGYFNEVLARMKEREKELSEIIELLG